MTERIPLPPAVARIYEAVAELEALYPGRKFTPDGHLVGSIGEVVAAEALGLTLYPASKPGHDGFDDTGDVQIKMTGKTGKSVSLYATCVRLVVLKVVSLHEAEIIYDGPGEPVWAAAGRMQKNGQRSIRLAKLFKIATDLKPHQSRFAMTAADVIHITLGETVILTSPEQEASNRKHREMLEDLYKSKTLPIAAP